MTCSAKSLRTTLLAAGSRPLLLDAAGAALTGAELLGHVERLAGAIAARGIGPAPKVGLWYRNAFAAVEAFLAVEWLGGTRVPVDPNATGVEAAAIFAAAGVDAVVADEEHAARLGGTCLVHDDRSRLAGTPRAPLADIPPERSIVLYPRAVKNGELSAIPISYANWAAIIETNVALYRSGRYGAWEPQSELFLTAQQIMHGTGFLGTFPFLAMGLPQLVVGAFEPTAIVAAIERFGVTATMVVPAMLKAIVEEAGLRQHRRSSMRHLLYGGGKSAAGDISEAVRLFGPVLTQVYGRVEGGWPLALLGCEDHAELATKPWLATSLGRPISEVEVRLRADGCGPDTGELLVRSRMTSSDFCDPDGWCSLGDRVRRDDDGYLYFERRLDRMINSGYHVYPEEVEAVIAAVEGVSRVLVKGEPHPRWGEMVVAYIVAAQQAKPETLAEELRAVLANRLAKYKVPRELRFVEDLPPVDG